MHDFFIREVEDKKVTIMFCRKCGQTFRLVATGSYAYWHELAGNRNPTCQEVVAKLGSVLFETGPKESADTPPD